MTGVSYDPTIYRGTAAFYARGRPAYSRDLVPTLVAEAALDGTSRLLDAGSGPGVLTIALAGHVAEAIGLDPDAEMLAEGARALRRLGSATFVGCRRGPRIFPRSASARSSS